jgi:hypothetical protein
MCPSGSRAVSQKVNFCGLGNTGASPRLPLGEERANILLLTCCYQEGSKVAAGIEPDGCQFSPVQLGLSGCVFSAVGIPGCSETPPRTADVTAQSQRGRGAAPSTPLLAHVARQWLPQGRIGPPVRQVPIRACSPRTTLAQTSPDGELLVNGCRQLSSAR